MVEMDVSLICKALGDSNRLRIVRALLEGEMCACRLLEQFGITQPTLSHHMKVLCDCGLEGADLRRARELTERYDDLLLLTAAEIPDHLP